MQVISESQERTVTTPTGVMASLATPSQGSAEVSTWRVRMVPGPSSPVHVIDRDQVWMPVNGSFEFTVGDEATKVAAGQALVVPAGTIRQYHATADPSEALVCMLPDGKAAVSGTDEFRPVPWAV